MTDGVILVKTAVCKCLNDDSEAYRGQQCLAMCRVLSGELKTLPRSVAERTV